MAAFVSLYTDVGGLDLDFIAAGFTPIFVNDISGDAIETHAATLNIINVSMDQAAHKAVTDDIRQVDKLPTKRCAAP